MLSELSRELEKAFENSHSYAKIFAVSVYQAEKEIFEFIKIRKQAIMGNFSARKYIINTFSRLIASDALGISKERVVTFFDFEAPEKNEVKTVFEMLLAAFDISELIEKYKLNVKVSEEDVFYILERERAVILDFFKEDFNKIRLISTIIYSKTYGQDCIDSLQHHKISEIGVLDKSYIYIVYKGSKLYLKFLCFDNSSILLNIQKKSVQYAPYNYDTQNPVVISSKDNSSRVTVSGYDLTPDDEALYYNERIFNLKTVTLEELRDTYRTIDDAIYEFLVLNQRGRGTFYITGADMGLGKTTFLLAMIEKIPDKWGIGIIDTQNELQARKKYPEKNILTYIENSKVNIKQCFETMLKTARDVIIVGEVTKPEEAAQHINACLRLNAGAGATMHSSSPYETVVNLRNLMMRTDMYNSAETAENDIARGIDFIIHLSRLKGGRIVVDRIIEIDSLELYSCADVYTEARSPLKALAIAALRKYTDASRYRYIDIFKYSENEDRWQFINTPSNRYFQRIRNHLTENEIKASLEMITTESQRLSTQIKQQTG